MSATTALPVLAVTSRSKRHFGAGMTFSWHGICQLQHVHFRIFRDRSQAVKLDPRPAIRAESINLHAVLLYLDPSEDPDAELVQLRGLQEALEHRILHADAEILKFLGQPGPPPI